MCCPSNVRESSQIQRQTHRDVLQHFGPGQIPEGLADESSYKGLAGSLLAVGSYQ